MERKCIYCNEDFDGRADKKFCTPYCKSAYHYACNSNNDHKDSLFKQIDQQLKKNRRLLKKYNKAGLAKINASTLLEEGFDPSYFTHYWKNKKGQVYLFCYEYGFLNLKESQKPKYLLVTWQQYMNKT